MQWLNHWKNVNILYRTHKNTEFSQNWAQNDFTMKGRKTATFRHQKQSMQTLWSSENYHHLIIALTLKMSFSTFDTRGIKTFPSWSKSVDKQCFISFSYRLCDMICWNFEKNTWSVTMSLCVSLSFPAVHLFSSQFLYILTASIFLSVAL